MKNKMLSYVKYAVGEILLVVVGILIAVSINNWNESRKQNNELESALLVVAEDLENSIAIVNVVLEEYVKDGTMLEHALIDTESPKGLEECERCYTVLTSYPAISIDRRGYKILSSFKDFPAFKEDSLITEIIQFYTPHLKHLDNLDKTLAQGVHSNLEYWRDNYPWFSDLMSGKRNKDFIEYTITNSEYRNKLVYLELLVYGNYVPILESYKSLGLEIQEKIKERNKGEN